MLTKAETKKLYDTLAQLGGKSFKEEDIVFEGDKLVLPEKFRGQLDRAVNFLNTKRQEEEAPANFSRNFNYRPWDGAVNAFNAIKKAFGMAVGKPIPGFFGDTPPQYIQVPVSLTETVEVPWGRFQIPLLDKTDIYFGGVMDAEVGQIFNITISSPRKNRFVIEGLFKLIEEELKEGSIYRGKAIDGKQMPNFLDLSGVSRERVIYSEQVEAELEANVWGFMRHTEEFLKLGMPSKRSVLLEGPYGTGKTMTANVTALEAGDNGWTFILARPGRDDFFEVMQTAKLYQPAVVFMEDADTFAAEQDNDHISQLLDVFDGIQSKATKIMVVLTTNHREKLTVGMRRPGRIDQIINIGMLDKSGMERLLRMAVGEKLDANVDFDAVCEACTGYFPAFLKEVADRSIRYAVTRNNGSAEGLTITTQDLVFSANALRPQYEWMRTDVEVEEDDDLGKAVRRQLERTLAELAPNQNYIGGAEYSWNVDRIVELRKNNGIRAV